MISEKDLLELRKIFMDEADDLFKKIEKGLLAIEKSPDDATLIATLFRSIHTLKGSSGMIGSKKVTDFVHNLETIFDYARSGFLKLTPDIIDCTLKSMDHIKRIIVDPELEDAKDAKNDKELNSKINKILEGFDGKKSSDFTESIRMDSEVIQTYHIYFQPGEDVFEDGTNPLLLIDELTAMGQSVIYTHIDLSSIKKYNPKKCYTSWHVILSTASSEASLSDVFIFVDSVQNKIDINLLSESNLLSNTRFLGALPSYDESHAVLGFEFLKKMSNQNDIKPIVEADINTPVIDDNLKKENSISSIRVSSDKLDELMNHVSELVTTQAGLSLYAKNNFDPTLDSISDNIEKLARQLRDIAFEMTLIEIENLFARFHRSVRDISSKLGKSVNFITEGGDTELDKKIIENLADPLMHLIRNSLDHGIETKEERLLKKKTEKGTIILRSYHSGAKVFVQIEDDGKGIDVEKIKDKALKNGLIKKNDKLTDKEALDLIFVPGFSMAGNVTDLSGRGVGMDVVKRNVLDLRGDIAIDTTIDRGTKITIGLPLTLSVIDGLQVRVDNTFYIIPLTSVVKCFELPRALFINDFNQVVSLDGIQYPYLDLRGEFHLSDETEPLFSSIIVVQNDGKHVGFCVDEIIGEYQAVLKPVGKYYRNQEFVSGATILGDGTIALVLDTNNLVNQKIAHLKKEKI